MEAPHVQRAEDGGQKTEDRKCGRPCHAQQVRVRWSGGMHSVACLLSSVFWNLTEAPHVQRDGWGGRGLRRGHPACGGDACGPRGGGRRFRRSRSRGCGGRGRSGRGPRPSGRRCSCRRGSGSGRWPWPAAGRRSRRASWRRSGARRGNRRRDCRCSGGRGARERTQADVCLSKMRRAGTRAGRYRDRFRGRCPARALPRSHSPSTDRSSSSRRGGDDRARCAAGAASRRPGEIVP
jgi:hypothetical protein